MTILERVEMFIARLILGALLCWKGVLGQGTTVLTAEQGFNVVTKRGFYKLKKLIFIKSGFTVDVQTKVLEYRRNNEQLRNWIAE